MLIVLGGRAWMWHGEGDPACPSAHSLPGHGIPEGQPPPRIPATAKIISEIKLKTL